MIADWLQKVFNIKAEEGGADRNKGSNNSDKSNGVNGTTANGGVTAGGSLRRATSSDLGTESISLKEDGTVDLRPMSKSASGPLLGMQQQSTKTDDVLGLKSSSSSSSSRDGQTTAGPTEEGEELNGNGLYVRAGSSGGGGVNGMNGVVAGSAVDKSEQQPGSESGSQPIDVSKGGNGDSGLTPAEAAVVVATAEPQTNGVAKDEAKAGNSSSSSGGGGGSGSVNSSNSKSSGGGGGGGFLGLFSRKKEDPSQQQKLQQQQQQQQQGGSSSQKQGGGVGDNSVGDDDNGNSMNNISNNNYSSNNNDNDNTTTNSYDGNRGPTGSLGSDGNEKVGTMGSMGSSDEGEEGVGDDEDYLGESEEAGAEGYSDAGAAEDNKKPCIEDFSSLRVLGKGSYGKVVLVRKKDTGVLYAMKILKKGDVVRKRQIERTKIERRVLGNIDHPFLMKLHYAFQTGNKLYLVLDYCPGGELFFHLSRYKRFPEGVVRFYGAEMVMALKHLHDSGIIYRDIKPENILLDKEGHVKLGDFGLAKDNITDATFGAQSVCGTPEYMAPEVIAKTGHGTAVDWWGLGMLMYEMLTGLPPWYTKDRQKLFERLRAAPLVIPKFVTPPAASIIQGLLTRNPTKRLGALGATQVMNHEFFRGLDWDALLSRRIPAPLNPCRSQPHDSESTANFDPQFTRLPVDTMVPQGEGALSPGHELNFDGFTYEQPVMDGIDAA